MSVNISMLGLGWAPDSVGGLDRYFRELYDGLRREGHKPRAVVVGPASSAPPEVSVVAAGQSVPRRVLAAASAAVRQARVSDVLDVHFALYAALPLQSPALRALPVVVHYHGPWASESAAMGERRVGVAVKRLVERSVIRRADRFVVLSDAFREDLLAHGAAPDHISVIRPGVQLDRFRPLSGAEIRESRSRLGVGHDALLCVSVRRLVPRMGIDVLLDAWDGVRRSEPRAVLVVIGDGPERATLERHRDRLDLGSSVEFVGRVDDATLPLWYGIADLALVPSLALEGFGLVLLEALACGTPVLASQLGGMSEALKGLPSWHLVTPGSPAAWQSAIVRALAPPGGGTTREDCRAYAAGFTWQVTARNVVTIYHRAIAQARSPSR